MSAIYKQRQTVAFQDVDAAGIVFFARVFDYAHDAWVACLRKRGIDLAQVLEEKKWISPLVHAESDYRKPMRFGDVVEVDIVRVGLGTTSMTVEFRVRGMAPNEDTIFCTGKLISTFIDRAFHKIEVPAPVRAAFPVE